MPIQNNPRFYLKTVEQATALEHENNLVNDGADVLLLNIDNKVSFGRGLVGVVDAGETLDLTGTSGLVDATAIRLLRVLERGGDVNEEEGTRLLNKLTGLLAGLLKGSNRSRNDGSAGSSQLRCDVSDAGDVEIAVGTAEAQLGGKLRADGLAEEHGHGAATTLVEGGLQGAGNLVLARVLETSHEDGEALLAGQRVLLAENLDDLGVGEPLGNLLAGAEAVSKLGARNVHGAGALGDLVGGHVLVAVGDVDHLLELDHLDAELLLVLLD